MNENLLLISIQAYSFSKTLVPVEQNELKSIPMWIFGIGAVGVSAWGLYEMSMNLYSSWFDTSFPSGLSELGLKKPSPVGFIMFVAGAGAAAAGNEQCHQSAAGLDRQYLPAGRRYRCYEHHAGIRNRKN